MPKGASAERVLLSAAPILGWLADTYGGRTPMVVGGAAAFLAAGIGAWARRCYIVSDERPET